MDGDIILLPSTAYVGLRVNRSRSSLPRPLPHSQAATPRISDQASSGLSSSQKRSHPVGSDQDLLRVTDRNGSQAFLATCRGRNGTRVLALSDRSERCQVNPLPCTVSPTQSINEVSIFLLANTGEGDPPENTIKFLKVLKGKE